MNGSPARDINELKADRCVAGVDIWRVFDGLYDSLAVIASAMEELDSALERLSDAIHAKDHDTDSGLADDGRGSEAPERPKDRVDRGQVERAKVGLTAPTGDRRGSSANWSPW